MFEEAFLDGSSYASQSLLSSGLEALALAPASAWAFAACKLVLCLLLHTKQFLWLDLRSSKESSDVLRHNQQSLYFLA